VEKISIQKILAVETSGKTFSVALSQVAKAKISHSEKEIPSLLGEVFLEVGLRHSEILKESCRFLMEQCALDKRDLTHCAVSTGPGSFTGLRVGIAFARAFCQALELPLVGVPVFEVMARKVSALALEQQNLLCILIDSTGGKVHYGLFKIPGAHLLSPYRTSSIDDLCRRLRAFGRKTEVLFAGDGVQAHREEIGICMGKPPRVLPANQNFLSARELAFLAHEKVKKFKPGPNSWRKVVPLYLREPMAVERLKLMKE